MTGALAAALLLLAPDAEETSYLAVAALFAAETPAPEPPAGLRAPPGTERHEAARARYAALLADWRAEEDRRLRRVVEECERHRREFPAGKRRNDIVYLRGAARFQAGDHAGARADLEAYLDAAPAGASATAARAALVESCRAQGDYSAALRHGGPDPDLLEEAGQVDSAIDAATRAGLAEKAAQWALIGRPLPGPVAIPQGAKAVVVAAGKNLDSEHISRLRTRFSADSGKVVFVSASGTYPAAVYLLDSQGVVQAVDPRPDTLEHRIRRLIRRG